MRVGNQGRVTLPAEVRRRRDWVEGTAVVVVETEPGVVLAEQGAIEDVLRHQLAGSNIVATLLEERRRASAAEDEM